MRRLSLTHLYLVFIATALAGTPIGAAEKATPVPSKAAESTPPNVATILERMERRQQELRLNVRPYTVIREYQLFGQEKGKANSDVIAEINFVPPDKKRYQIRQASGSSHGEKVVRKILDKEAELANDSDATAVDRRNYQFKYLGQDVLDGHKCYVLVLTPTRKEKDLIHGRAWVDATTFELRQVQGAPAKSPSWWLKNVQFTLKYAIVQGMWLQTGTEAVANVRFFGKHILTSRELDIKAGQVVASTGLRSEEELTSPAGKQAGVATNQLVQNRSASATKKRRRVAARRPPPPVPVVVGAGVFVQR